MGVRTSKALFPTLTGGPGGIGRSATERHQRGRLEGAMVEAVARHGYVDTTVSELVGLAGVSKSTFYQHFKSKQDCFLSTFEAIVSEATARVGSAYRSHGSLEERLAAAFLAFAEIVAEESAAASLVIVDSLSLGTAAVAHRERAAEVFELMLRQSFQREPSEVQPSDLQSRVIVGGVQMIVYRSLRSGRSEELKQHLDPVVQWALSYGTPTAASRSLPRRRLLEEQVRVSSDEPAWSEPPASPSCRAKLTQRERIIRAVAQLTAEAGYAALSIPAISAVSGTSNQTFYEHFEGKQQAFIAAFGELTTRALEASFAAIAGATDWYSAVEAGIRGLLTHIVAEPLFARIAFFELPAAGAAALDHADAAISRFTDFLEPQVLPDELQPLPSVVREAVGGGIWAAIQHEIANGNLDSLPGMAPEMAEAMLAPLRPR